MNEELDTELDNELDNEIENEESEVEIELADDGDGEGDNKPEEKPVAERPWNKKEEDKDTRIPVSRFSEVNAQRKEAEAKAARLEQELAQYRSKQEELAKIKSPADIKPENYKTVEEYLAARDEAVIAQASVNAEKRFVEREQKRIIEEQHNARMTRFENNYNEAVKSIREIHKLGAKLTREAKAEAKEAEKKPVNLKPMQTQAKPAAPAKVKGKTVVRKSVDDMTQAEYE